MNWPFPAASATCPTVVQVVRSEDACTVTLWLPDPCTFTSNCPFVYRAEPFTNVTGTESWFNSNSRLTFTPVSVTSLVIGTVSGPPEKVTRRVPLRPVSGMA